MKVEDKSLLDCIKFDKVMFEENLNNQYKRHMSVYCVRYEFLKRLRQNRQPFMLSFQKTQQIHKNDTCLCTLGFVWAPAAEWSARFMLFFE